MTKLLLVNGALCLDGNPVETMGPKGLHQFIGFMKDIENPVLVGHNIETFDLMFLYHHLNKYDQCDEFAKAVVGFVDTQSLFLRKSIQNRL